MEFVWSAGTAGDQVVQGISRGRVTTKKKQKKETSSKKQDTEERIKN